MLEPLSWKVYINGAANQRGSGVGLVVISLEKIIIEKSLRLGFPATNNEAEYEALLIGMTMVQKMGGRIPRSKNTHVRCLRSRFKSFTLLQIPRSKNTNVDSVATLATSSMQSLP